VLAKLEAARTLFIVCSKSFRTPETLANAEAARRWLRAQLGADADLSRHILGVSSNVPAARAFGIAAENILPMWDWVGGRFSLWSAVGLPIAIATGWTRFAEVLAAPKRWTSTSLHAAPATTCRCCSRSSTSGTSTRSHHAADDVRPTRAPSTCSRNSCSSSRWRATARASRRTARRSMDEYRSRMGAPPGTDAQHSYFQWLHQGTIPVNVELIVPVNSRHGARSTR
jgi:glucose-6-phosphate isomerase